MTINQFRVPEMSCQHCVNAITKEISALPGIKQIQINLADKSVRVEHDDQLQSSTLIKAINDAGYDEVAVLA